jgi:hypothetical protein
MGYVSPNPQACILSITRQSTALAFTPIDKEINGIAAGPCKDFHDGDMLAFVSNSEWLTEAPFYFKNNFNVNCGSPDDGASTTETNLGKNRWSTKLSYDQTVKCDVTMAGGSGSFAGGRVEHACTTSAGEDPACVHGAVTGFASIELRIITDPPRPHQFAFPLLAISVLALAAVGYALYRQSVRDRIA